MKTTAATRVTVRGGLLRLSLFALAGAFLGAVALFVWTAATVLPDDLFAGFKLDGSLFIGAFLGLFFGGLLGWLWLVVAVGRESHDGATVAPNKPEEPASRERGSRES